ncbi:hypothetical protein AB4Y44_28030 [Paraburkholderia sp. BR10937]|uniref:hypothetical protein n=1 Tax=Paraburkholderia sp. BR10937 TaxID=3236994 RepID=UPI0034D2C095
MTDVAHSINCIQLTGRSASQALDYIRRYAQENGGLVCAQVPAAQLPPEIQGVLEEVACICITTPAELDESSEPLTVECFDVYNTDGPNLPGMATVCLVGGRIELDARKLSLFDALESTFPVVFVHKRSWTFVAYPWNPSIDIDLLQCAMMSSGENHRPLRDENCLQGQADDAKAVRAKCRPSWYGSMYDANDLIESKRRELKVCRY